MRARPSSMPPALGWLVGLAAALVFSLLSSRALAFTPPPLSGAVNDAAGLLTPQERQELERLLAEHRKAHGHEVVVFTAPSLGAETIEDAAYATFNAWGVGKKDKDNGVLLMVAPKDRRLRIESGKGVGGALTDLVSKRILTERVGPKLKVNKNFEALRDGVVSIHSVLLGGPVVPLGEDAGAAPTVAAPRHLEPPEVSPTSLFVDTTGSFPADARARYLAASDAAQKKGAPLLAVIVVDEAIAPDAPVVAGANSAAFYRAFPAAKAIAVIGRDGRNLYVYYDLERDAKAEAVALQDAASRAKGVVGSAPPGRRPEVFVDEAITLLGSLASVRKGAWQERIEERSAWWAVPWVVGILAFIAFATWLVGKLGLSGGSGGGGGGGYTESSSGGGGGSSSGGGGGYTGGGGSSGGGGASDSY